MLDRLKRAVEQDFGVAEVALLHSKLLSLMSSVEWPAGGREAAQIIGVDVDGGVDNIKIEYGDSRDRVAGKWLPRLLLD